MKKILTGLLIGGSLLLTACSGNKEEAESKDSNGKGDPLAGISEKNVVSERKEEINGKEVTIKKFKDGSEIALPNGMTADEFAKDSAKEKSIEIPQE